MKPAESARKARVLWVDDNPYQIQMYVMALRHGGHDVKVVDEIDDRIPRPVADYFDMVLVDYRLPNELDLNGPDCLLDYDRELQDAIIERRVVCYVVSAMPTTMYSREWHLRTGIGYISKSSLWPLSDDPISAILSAEGSSK